MTRVIRYAALLMAVSASAKAQQIEFRYKIPPRVAAFAPLKAWFDVDARTTRAKFNREVVAARAAARKDGFPFRGWGATREWKIVTETPRFLSLSVDGYDYSGGAHGMPWSGGLLYDKVTHQRIKPITLFTAPAALSRVIRADFCRLLDKERVKRRGEPVDRKDMFGECIDPVESTVILGSSSGRAFDRIGVLVGPYAAGSYAEGSYDLTLPVTPAIVAQVKQQYRTAFAVPR